MGRKGFEPSGEFGAVDSRGGRSRVDSGYSAHLVKVIIEGNNFLDAQTPHGGHRGRVIEAQSAVLHLSRSLNPPLQAEVVYQQSLVQQQARIILKLGSRIGVLAI